VSLQVFVPDKAAFSAYTGKHTTADIKAFVSSRIPDMVLPLKQPSAVEALMHACGAPAGNGAGKRTSQKVVAKWNLCAVLVADSDESPPLLRSFALQHRGKVGLIPCLPCTLESEALCDESA
jgi:hypothetical protein